MKRRDFLKSAVVGLASIVLSGCKKREVPAENNENDKVNNNKKKDEITMYVQEERYIYIDGYKAKASEWGPCLWDETGNHIYYVGYVGIVDGNFCLASDGNAPFMLSLGKRVHLQPDPKYHKFSMDANEIDFLGKKYEVIYVDANKITLKLPDEEK